MREQARAQIEGREPKYRICDIVSPAILAEAQDKARRTMLVGARMPQSLKKSKYRNAPEFVDNKRFDSKLEADYYRELKLRRAAGEVLWFIRQPMFDLPGGVRYRADFLAVLATGGVEVTDAKGFDTRESTNKRKQVAELYGVTVQLWPPR